MGVQGVWGTGGMGHMGNRPHGVMGHMGNGVTWAMGHMGPMGYRGMGKGAPWAYGPHLDICDLLTMWPIPYVPHTHCAPIAHVAKIPTAPYPLWA